MRGDDVEAVRVRRETVPVASRQRRHELLEVVRQHRRGLLEELRISLPNAHAELVQPVTTALVAHTVVAPVDEALVEYR